jgi:AAA+ ATPase superfamily predicted ATPase
MAIRVNPFRPYSPVNPGMFVGRIEEIQRLEQALVQSRSGKPAHFMVTGERGIGKTSLLLYLKYLAQGDIPFNSDKFHFLVLDLDLDASTTQLGFIQRIQMHLEHQLGKSEPALSFLKEVWAFLQRVRIMDSGITVKPTEVSDEVLLDEFALSLAKVCDRTCLPDSQSLFSASYDGFLLLIDEADNCSIQLQLGSFLKLLVERLQRNGCDHILICLAGLPDLRSKLYASHPSSLRIFEDLQLERLTSQEVVRVINICLDKANEGNPNEINITDEAKGLLVELSEGYPHFIQQFGYSAFAVDNDNIIDGHDVEKSAFGPRGALDLIGDRYYRNDFYNKIQQDSYRQVLRIMADDLDGWVTRAKIRSKFKGKDSILNNAIKALRDRHIILSKEGEKGIYRLQHKGFALWIKLYADPDFRKSILAAKNSENINQELAPKK